MKILIRIICLILSAVMIFMINTACFKNKTNNTNTSTSNMSGTASNPDGSGYTWNTSYELDWYVGIPYYLPYDKEKAIVHKTIYDRTGLSDINFISTSDGSNDKLNAFLVAGTLPDLITLQIGSPQVQVLQNSGLLYPLNELIDKYAPNFKGVVPEEAINWGRASDGNWYGMYYRTVDPEKIKNSSQSHNIGMIARQDIMELLGLKPEDFNTQDGMANALKKVKDAKLVQNEVPIIPFYCTNTIGDNIYDFVNSIAQFFGISPEDAKGNYVEAVNHPKFFEMLQFLNRLYLEGLLIRDNFLIRKSQFNEYIMNGNVFLSIGTVLGVKDAYIQSMNNGEGKVSYIHAGPVLAKDHTEPYYPRPGMNTWLVTFVPKSAKNPDRIIQLIEYLYSVEGQLLISFGIEGVTYTWDEENRIKWTDEVLALRETDYMEMQKRYGMDTLYFIGDGVTRSSHYPRPQTEAGKIVDQIADHFHKGRVYISDAASNIYFDPSTEEAVIQAKVRLYLNEELIKVVTASSAERCTMLFREILEQLEDIGLSKLQDAKNDKFQENKKKLGVEFIYPGKLH